MHHLPKAPRWAHPDIAGDTNWRKFELILRWNCCSFCCNKCSDTKRIISEHSKLRRALPEIHITNSVITVLKLETYCRRLCLWYNMSGVNYGGWRVVNMSELWYGALLDNSETNWECFTDMYINGRAFQEWVIMLHIENLILAMIISNRFW